MKIIFSRDIMKNPLRITFQVLFAMETLYLVTKHTHTTEPNCILNSVEVGRYSHTWGNKL